MLCTLRLAWAAHSATPDFKAADSSAAVGWAGIGGGFLVGLRSRVSERSFLCPCALIPRFVMSRGIRRTLPLVSLSDMLVPGANDTLRGRRLLVLPCCLLAGAGLHRLTWAVGVSSSSAQSLARSMETSRVLDARLGNLPPDAEAGDVVEAVAAVSSDMHSSVRVKRYEKSLEANGYDTIGGLVALGVGGLALLGVPQGHAKLILRCLFPPSLQQPASAPPTPSHPVPQPDSPYLASPMEPRSGPEFCELSATGAPTSKGSRAWIITSTTFIGQYVEPSTLVAIQVAASNPLVVGAEWHLPSEQSRIVFDMLVGCGPRGLPADLLLAFPPDVVAEALGVAALAFISRQVLVATDEGAAALQAWRCVAHRWDRPREKVVVALFLLEEFWQLTCLIY